MEQNLLALAALRGAELRREAARDHLARLATCCRPSTWRRWLEAWTARREPCAC